LQIISITAKYVLNLVNLDFAYMKTPQVYSEHLGRIKPNCRYELNLPKNSD
jgi:hypothetical protein